jgi:hypothetical protein
MTVTVLDRALVAGDAGRVTGEQERPDPEVPEKARRRTFTAQYKLDVVAEYDAAATGEKGAVLRREGLHSSHVIEWRRARDAGALAGPDIWLCSLATSGTCGGRARAAAHQAPTMWACTRLALVGDPDPGALQRCPASGHGLVVQEHVHDAPARPVKAARPRVLTLRRCGDLIIGQPLPGQPRQAAMTHATEPGMDGRPG